MLPRMDLLYAAHVPAGDGPFPTLIALHGWGASAHDLLGLAPILHRGEALVLCPQGPVQIPIEQGIVGYGWFPIRTDGPQDPAEFEKGRDVLARWIDGALQRYPVDPRKTVLMGFSQGGVMAYDLALRDPARYAGLLAMSAWLPPEMAAGIPSQPDHANLPTLVIHGTDDPMIPIDRAHASRDALVGLGVSPNFREYPMGHEIHPEALRDIVVWLEEKVLSPIQLV